MSPSHAATMTPTVSVTVAMFDQNFDPEIPVFRVKRSESLREFGSLIRADYNPRGGTPLRDATMEMIHHLDGRRSPDTIQIGLLLDESGSMQGNEESVVAGVNEFVEGLKNIPAKDGGRVLCVIFTDGHENASHHVSPEDLRQAVGERENDGWTFIYMGANQDAWAEGSANVGISGGVRGQSVNFTSSPVGTKSAFRSAGGVSAAYLADEAEYDVAVAAMGNNRTITEEGDEIAPTPTASPSMPKPGGPKKPKAAPKKPKPKPAPKPKPYGDVSGAMNKATDALKKAKGD